MSLAHVSKVLLLGLSSDDIASPAIYTGNLQALKDDRLEIYPYAHEPTRVLFRKVPREQLTYRFGAAGLPAKLSGLNCRAGIWKTFMAELLQRCASKKAYISIDKDCLRSDHALTNWEEGRFSLDELLRLLKVIQETMDIVGLDITGEYSEPVVSGRIKALCSRLDHPADYSACAAPPKKSTQSMKKPTCGFLNSCSAGD